MKNDMKRIIAHMAACLAALAAWSCSGNVDPEGEKLTLGLSADKSTIAADGKDAVRFTVMYGLEDVTSEARITCEPGGSLISDAVFTTSESGTYVFTASYDDAVSEPFTVTAEALKESRFQRHVCIMEFTGTWCAQCPAGALIVNYLTEDAYKGRAFGLAFHNDDIYTIPQEAELQKIFKWSGYPAYVTDMRDSGLFGEGGCSVSVDKSLFEDPTHCGVAVECTYDETEGTVEATARVFSEKSSEYRIAAYVVEDHVIGEQKLADGTTDKEYSHRHVVRKMLSASVLGDNLGQIASGAEKEKKYSFSVDKDWKAGYLYVAVLAIDEDGEVNNMAICKANNGKMDYEYTE